MAIQRGYKAVLSTKHEVQIDPDEIEDVIKGAAAGQLIQVRQGIINPSYLVVIIDDADRRRLFNDDLKYLHGQDEKKRRGLGMEPLADILDQREQQIALPAKHE